MNQLNQISILHGNTFVVSDRSGDIDATPDDPSGLFSFDTRFLSKWILTLDGRRLTPLSVDDLQYYETRFFLVSSTGTVYVNAKLSVIRHRTVCDGFDEELVILNHDDKPVDVMVRLDAANDFADLFEVKDDLAKKGTYYARIEEAQLVLGYERDELHRQTMISAGITSQSAADQMVDGHRGAARFDEHGLSFSVHIGAHSEWAVQLHVSPVLLMSNRRRRKGAEKIRTPDLDKSDLRAHLRQWLAQAPRLQCDWDSLVRTYRQSLVDLAALRFTPLTSPGRSLPAAGLPWFMALFGRDSILTSLQALPFEPDLARTTLRELGLRQGSRHDDFRDEEPGKILHEVRYGETVAFEERPQSPYYGSADATPLFVVLLDEYERWTGDTELVRQMEFAVRMALNWIDEHADLMGNGYVAYQRRNELTGLENQCWKDSWDSISYHDGRLPTFPRATCELQGYAYDAKVRGARLARLVWGDQDYAARLEREAADLKTRFNRDFWMADRECFAVGIDPSGRPVDTITSNIGHLLWSGIVDDAKADRIRAHLMGPKMFSGWGVRTLAVGEGRYNPIGYHTGTVWPFDNSFIAWGLRRHGYADDAARIAAGILHAAEYFDGRLPEAFGGYDRRQTKYPVQYPTACSPQAWSTGAPLLLLRTMLGLEPMNSHLVVDPALPAFVGRMELLDIKGRWGQIDAFGRGRVEVENEIIAG
jgi:glycogen debranching enzyme